MYEENFMTTMEATDYERAGAAERRPPVQVGQCAVAGAPVVGHRSEEEKRLLNVYQL